VGTSRAGRVNGIGDKTQDTRYKDTRYKIHYTEGREEERQRSEHYILDTKKIQDTRDTEVGSLDTGHKKNKGRLRPPFDS
jgi:hypothetical protein